MRIANFFRSSAMVLTLFSLIMLSSAYWAAITLSTSQQQTAQYQALRYFVQVDFQRTVNDYLSSGNATLLTTANKQVLKLRQQIEQLPQPQLKRVLLNKVSGIEQLLATKIRALGKLAGDPMAILTNSETSIAAILQQLSSFARQQQDSQVELARNYQLSINHMLGLSGRD